MTRKFLLLIHGILLLSIAHAQPKKIIVCMGSSTTAGMGADPIDSAWVNLMTTYYTNLGLVQQVFNIGRSGLTTYEAMPTGFIPPADRPLPLSDYNVTKALSYHPDIVIVNYPTNDVGYNFATSETMDNLRTIYKMVTDAGAICYVTTTQPRTSFVLAQRMLLKVERDSITNEFGTRTLNFYNPIVAADSLTINPIYNYDGTHVNNQGHQLLFQVVTNANPILITPLPLSLTGFTAALHSQKVDLSWTTGGQTGAAVFSVQRSADGSSFEDIGQEQTSDPSLVSHTWTDAHPLTGHSYYRIKFTEQGDITHYSTIASISNGTAGWSIGKSYSSGAASWNLEIRSDHVTRFQLSIFSAEGKQVLTQPVDIDPPSRLLSLKLPSLAKGQYFIRLISEKGERSSNAIQIY